VHVRSLSTSLALAAALGSAAPASAALDAEILEISTNVLDCSLDLVFRVEDAGSYFANMWDDGNFRGGAGGSYPAGATVRIRFTIGGVILQGGVGVGLYVEDGLGPAATDTYDSRGSAQAWNDMLGTDCQGAGETFGAAVVSEEFPTGAKLALKGGSKPSLSLLSKDPRLGLGRGAGTPDDPTANGGSLRVLSEAGAPFDTTYPLPMAGWSLLSASNPAAGYRFRGAGADAIQSVIVKPGKQIKIKGKGAGLGHDLATDPVAVIVELRLGERRYCSRYGGTTSFAAGQSFQAVSAPADEFSCPPPAGP
jgi:hypothetical protein